MSRSLALCALMLLAGCATTPTPINKAVAVPPERVYFVPPANSGPTTSQIVVLRDTGLQGGGVYAHFFINGERAASLDTGEILKLTITPGDYILGVHLTDPLRSSATFSIDQTIKAGNVYYYRISVDYSSGTRIQRIPHA